MSGEDIRKEMMPFKKFAQVHGGLMQDEKRWLIGIFKDTKTGDIIEGDNFFAEVAGNAEKTYKLYLQWNNEIFEEQREFVSAKWDEKPIIINQTDAD